MATKKKIKDENPDVALPGEDDVTVSEEILPREEQVEAALLGHFVHVVAGEHAGRYGAFTDVAETDEDGNPTVIILATRDNNAENLLVAYADCVRGTAGQR